MTPPVRPSPPVRQSRPDRIRGTRRMTRLLELAVRRPAMRDFRPTVTPTLPVPTANPKRLTSTANRLILAPDERSLQVDLVCIDPAVPVAGCAGSRNTCASTSAQRPAAQSPKRLTFSSIDRLLLVGLYRLAPGILDALKIMRPETLLRWHRAGFRTYWRWKSRCGSPHLSAWMCVRQTRPPVGGLLDSENCSSILAPAVPAAGVGSRFF